jgi:hypothetical protein
MNVRLHKKDGKNITVWSDDKREFFGRGGRNPRISIKLILTLTLLSCIKRKNNSILLNERSRQKALDEFS